MLLPEQTSGFGSNHVVVQRVTARNSSVGTHITPSFTSSKRLTWLCGLQGGEEPVWVDLCDPDDEELNSVGELLGLHPLAIGELAQVRS
jgi:Mg2+ and Co2+ transporter CorA